MCPQEWAEPIRRVAAILRREMDNQDENAKGRESTGNPPAEQSSEGGCSCCDGPDDDFEYYAAKLRLESEAKLIESNDADHVLDVELPAELQEALGEFLDESTVTTIGDWVAEVRARTGGGAITNEDLCHESSETGHWGTIDGETYHFTCFFDAVVLAALEDDVAYIRTESPSGTEIEATSNGDGGLTVDPPGTLMSFGIITAPGLFPDGEPTREDVYESMCPVVKAFPSPQAYLDWDPAVPATTVAIPLSEATSIVDALVA